MTQLFAADEHAPLNPVRLMSRRMACSQGEFHRGRRCCFAVRLPVEGKGVERSDALDPLDCQELPGTFSVAS